MYFYSCFWLNFKLIFCKLIFCKVSLKVIPETRRAHQIWYLRFYLTLLFDKVNVIIYILYHNIVIDRA
jgi:hypothetical protein